MTDRYKPIIFGIFCFITSSAFVRSFVESRYTEFGPVRAELITFLVAVAIAVVLTAVQILLAPTPNFQKPEEPVRAKQSDLTIPTIEEDQPVPLVYGKARSALHMLWFGDFRAEEITVEVETGEKDGGSEEIVVGFRHELGQLYALPVCDTVEEFFFEGKRVRKEMAVSHNGSFAAKTGANAKPNGSGSNRTIIRFYDGSQTNIDSYIEAQTGEPTAYLQRALLVFQRGFIGDNNTRVPRYEATVSRYVFPAITGSGWGAANVDGDANPAMILYDWLVTLLKIDSSQIDVDSFKAASITFANEGFGLSFLINRASTLESLIDELKRQSDCVVYKSTQTGLITMKLIRDDYTVETLPNYGEETFSEVKLAGGTWDQIATELTFNWTSRDHWLPRSDKRINPAARRFVGYNKSEQLAFPNVTTDAAAQQAIQRVVKRTMQPLFSFSGKASRNKFTLSEGDVFKYNDPQVGGVGVVDMILRVTRILSGRQKKNEITVEAIQDMFSVDDVDVLEIESPNTIPLDFILNDPVQHLTVHDSIPEFRLQKSIFVMAAPPATGVATHFEVFVNDASKGLIPIIPTGTLDTALGLTDGIHRSFAFRVTNANGIVAATSTEGSWQRGNIPIIVDGGADDQDWEIMFVRNIVATGSKFNFNQVIRDIAGTGQKTFNIGARVWVMPLSGLSMANRTLFLGSANLAAGLTVKARPVNAGDEGPEVQTNHTYGYRPETPYDVQSLTGQRNGGDTELSWIPRTRHGGATNFNPDTQPAFDDTPEGQVEITGSDGYGPVIVDHDSHSRTTGSTGITYTVKAVLNGRMSDGVQVVV